MKQFPLTVLLFFAGAASTACTSSLAKQPAQPDFTGAWSVDLCNEADPKLQCGTFDLYLVQDQQGRICGEHFVATPGLGRLDETDPTTVLGTIADSMAVVVIRSTRNEARYIARLSEDDDRIRWEIIGMVAEGLNNEPPIIPVKKILRRTELKEKMQHQKELASLPCEWPEWGS